MTRKQILSRVYLIGLLLAFVTLTPANVLMDIFILIVLIIGVMIFAVSLIWAINNL